MSAIGASSGRILYQLARADFLERARRYSFLFIMGISLYLGYAAATGRLVMRVNDSRGVFNSAWIGGLMALVSTTFLSLAGFYMVKNTIERDRSTRVGEILASTPMSKTMYAVSYTHLDVYKRQAYILARTSIAPCTIGGYDFPTGSTIIMAQWVMHRDARYFDDPEAFRPERWLDGLEDRLPAGAYFPFGDGPRRCIGQNFALMEAVLVIATVAQKFQLQLVAGQKIVPEALVTLRPRNGIRMRIDARR